MLEIKLMAMKYKLICIRETYLSAKNVQEMEITIPNIKLKLEDGKIIRIFVDLLFVFITH